MKKKIKIWVMAATLVCGASVMNSCKDAHAQEGMPLAVQHPEIPLE